MISENVLKYSMTSDNFIIALSIDMIPYLEESVISFITPGA